jgi:membrane-associated phospholipid phosphatase
MSALRRLRPLISRRRGSLVRLAMVSAAAVVFTVLLVLVRLHWSPLESVDHGAADGLNNLVAGHHTAITVIKAITLLGSTLVLSIVIGAAALLLALRRRWRLAAYLVATGVGALVLDPVLKVLVGRLRPVLAHPVAHAPGNSFPSGHSLGSIVCYGALFLVFLPAARGGWRTAFAIATAVLVVVIGFSRTLLGVHYISDVVGGWAIGIAWLGLTTFAFELTRRAAGRQESRPVAEGLEPEAGSDLRPADPERARQQHPVARIAAGLLVAWVLILGAIVGIGELVTRAPGGNVLGDQTVPRWLAAHRTPALTSWSLVFTTLGGTLAILAVAAAACLIFLGLTRRWRPVAYLLTLMLGELAMFLAAAAVVRRPRPPVSHLDHHLPTSAFPSGHEAATCCLYIGLAILVIGHARGWWRWLFLAPAIAFPLLVAASRMYRGEHHPTDVLASLLFAALWIPAVTLAIRLNRWSGQRTSSDKASMLAAKSAAVAGRAA